MKRVTKNIILVILVLMVGVAMFFTMNYAKNHVLTNTNTSNNMGEMGETPPEIPSGENNNDSASEPPEKPDGEAETGESMGEPPSQPEGENNANNGEQPPEMPNNTMNDNSSQGLEVIYYVVLGIESFVLSSLIIYFIMSRFNKKTIKETFSNGDKVVIGILSTLILTLAITYLSGKITTDYFINNTNGQTNGNNQPNGSQISSITYSGVKEITEDTTIDSGSFASTATDENAVLVSGDIDVLLSNIEVTKTGDSDGGDNSNFYGNNSGIIAKDGANLVLKNITVTTNASGANGVFSYGGSATTDNASSDGTTITISDSTITTTGNNAGGIMTTGGGNMKATNLTISTAGVSSAAIRTDRGGGTVVVDGGTYTTTGAGSPSIYSTANITVSNAKLIAKASEGIVIEGKNTVTITACDLTDSNTKLNGQSTTYKNIFLYQSMSGDAANGNAEFTAKDSKITTNNGDTFYVTNTTATINLENNTIVNNDSTGNFLRVQKDSWGNSGSNGGIVTLNMTNQNAVGNIVIDSISTLAFTLQSGSYYEGIINGDNSAKSITLTLDQTSKIKLTGDSYVSSLDNKDTTNNNIDFNGYQLYVNGKAIN